jgi:signal transduction histidine kinase
MAQDRKVPFRELKDIMSMMKSNASRSSKLSSWFKKNTQGIMLYQWISYIMVFTVLTIFILEYPANAPLDWHFYGAVLALGMLLVLNILWFQARFQIGNFREGTVQAGFLTLSTLLALGAFALTGRGEITFLMFMLSAQVATVFGLWPVGIFYSLLLLAACLGILRGYGTPVPDLTQTGAEFLAGLIFVLLVVLLERRSARETERAEQLLADLQAAHAELKAAHEKEKELAIAEERMRLAREIHDGLGHHLTALSIQLQAAEKLAERNPQAAVEAIRVSRTETQAALEEVRQSVGMMRQPPVESQPLVERLTTLVHDFGQNTGLQAAFQVGGAPCGLAPMAEQMLFRAVQESLTNIQKHAQGAQFIQVALDYGDEQVQLMVNDDGQPVPGGPVRPEGFGLVGLGERVRQLGGQLQYGPRSPAGFQVDITVPLKEIARDPRAARG